MPCKFSMIFFLEYLRILGTENTAGGASTRPREWRARPPHLVAPLVSWAPSGPPQLMPAPTHFILYPKQSPSSSSTSSSSFCCDFRSPCSKLHSRNCFGIVAWYVTPPLVQLVFVLVLYSLQIFAA